MRSDRSLLHRSAIFAGITLGLVALLSYPVKLVAQASAIPTAAQQSAEAKPKTAGEAFKNVQVLKDIRQDELIPSMRYVAAALGVRCDFCHVQNHFESDDKPEKARAREMIKMMLALNADNFHGHRVISCYTCHRGSEHPVGTPMIPDVAAMAAQMTSPAAATGAEHDHEHTAPGAPAEKHDGDAAGPGATAPAASMPTVEEILSKYTQALGGEDAIRKTTTRVEKGTVDVPEHNAHSTMEVYRKAPDKALAILHSQTGDVTEGYDGATAWESRAGRPVSEETGDSLNRVKEWASFFTALDLTQDYSRAMVNGTEKIGGHDAYRVFAFRNGGSMERLYFDTQSGLLLRADTRIDSPLGALPQETSYEDYRAVGGVKIPYTIRVAKIDSTTIYKWESIEPNVSVADDRFAKPAAAPPANDQPSKP
jgi:photosynthetic reaction center cytochrome c subunit